ncbi:hypothetical protein ACFLWS_08280 [Chloroflexota bacterium]
MVGSIPVSSRINSPRLSLGYRTVQALADGPFLRQGEIVAVMNSTGQFLETNAKTDNACRILEQDGRQEGFQKKKLLAPYIHLYLGSLSYIELFLVENCRQFRDGGNYRGTP